MYLLTSTNIGYMPVNYWSLTRLLIRSPFPSLLCIIAIWVVKFPIEEYKIWKKILLVKNLLCFVNTSQIDIFEWKRKGNSNGFKHWKLTSKVIFFHFFTAWHNVDFWPKNVANFVPLSFRLDQYAHFYVFPKTFTSFEIFGFIEE